MVATLQGCGILLRMGGNKLRVLSVALGCFAPAQQLEDSSELPERNPAAEEEEEYTEDFEQGVCVTVKRLAGGSRQVKRIKFSRELFSESQASLWWEENRARVRQHYASTGN